MHEEGAGTGSSVRLEPSGDSWARLARDPPGDACSHATRLALALPADRPVVMGGHQPGLWHPGILVKWWAIETLATRIGAAPAWIVVDQSPGAGATLAYPLRRGDSLARGFLTLGDVGFPPAAQRPARLDPPSDGATEGVARGLARAAKLLAAHGDASSLAHQLHGACAEALAPSVVRSSFASDLHTTAAFVELVGAMRADPHGCARLYNEAAAGHDTAGVRPLHIAGGSSELPLWERLSDPRSPGAWRTVVSDRLADLPDDRLVLRGLPMTGMLRRRACDLFVHGAGGGGEQGYDRVTERWLETWLGVTDLAPTVVGTATLRLRFDRSDMPTPEQIAHARAEAHRAEHDPSLLGQAELGRRKRELADQITHLDHGSDERAAIFRELHTIRSRAIEANPEALAALRARAEALADRAGEAEVAADRTWSFLFHDRGDLDALRERIGLMIGAPA